MSVLKDLIDIAKMNGRVCPQPMAWNDLWKMLPNKIMKGNGWEPALPLILAAWDDTPILSKIVRFQEHLEWAEQNNAIDQVFAFLNKLDEKDWYHGE